MIIHRPSFEEFEKHRQLAISYLQSLHYDNEPHFLVIVGNHDGIDTANYSCKSWLASVIYEQIKEHLPETLNDETP